MPPSPEQLIARCQTIMSHAWMVRTFVKHSPEIEEFPELMEVARLVFDLSRALEPRVADPAEYFQMLRKKIGKFRKAVEKFGRDAPLASVHTNFQQAVKSIEGCIAELEEVLAAAPPVKSVARPAPGPASESGPGPGATAEVQEDQME